MNDRGFIGLQRRGSGFRQCAQTRLFHLFPLAFGLAVLLSIQGCSDEGGSYAGVDLPEILVTPQYITFDQIPIGDTDDRLVTVENIGGSELVIASYQWEGFAEDFSITGLEGMRLQGSQARTFTITYSPTDEAVDLATLVIESNGGTVRVTVSSLGQAAILMTEPAVVELVADTVGSRVEQNVRIFNAGSEPFSLSSVSLVTGSGDFQMSLVDFGVPVEISIDDSVNVMLAYSPSARGIDEGALLLEHDAANAIDGQTIIPVTGSLRDPYLVVDPDFVAFGAVPRDETAVEEVELRNEGQAALIISDLYMTRDSSDEMGVLTLDGEDFIEGPYTEPYRIEPGESMPMEVFYTPDDTDPDQATVAIGSNDPDFPIYYLDMGGRLDAPYLTVYPWELAFGSVGNGITRTLGVVVRNIGSQPLLLNEPNLGNDPAFSLVNLEWWPDELASQETFELLVAFTPNRDGGIASTLTISASNDPAHSPIVIPLNGSGAGEPDCVLTPIPSTIDFGLVPRGSTQTNFSRILNSGSGECRIDNVSLSPQPFGGIGPFGDLFSDAFSLVSVSVPSGTVLSPGEDFIIEAAYSPIAFTALTEDLGDTGSIEIEATDLYDMESVQCGSVALFSFSGFMRECGVNLRGRSGVAELAAIPSEVDFGLVTVGCNSQEVTINLYNIGSLPVHIDGITLESCTSEFSLRGVPPTGYELPNGGAPLPIYVTYTPDSVSPSTCEVVIVSDAETAGRLVVPLAGEGTNLSEQTDHFEQISGRKVDVLFVVDNSGSMTEEQNNLSTNFDDFIAEAADWDTEFQIGIITVEPDEVFEGRNPGELIGDPRILTPSTPNIESEFADHANVGASGDGARESGLEASHLALSDPLISDVGDCGTDCVDPYSCVTAPDGSGCGGYNRGFLREDASLELVFLSDEPDQSRGTTEFYIDFFMNIKGVANTELLHASAIVGPRGGCSGAGGEAAAGEDYLDVADATGGITASICDTDFGPELTEIGNRAFGLRRQFVLSRIADPGTVGVYDSSDNLMGGWYFNEDLNSVVFNTQADAPDPGEEFYVTYTAQCF